MKYYNFILSILKQNRKKGDGELYYVHHILPRSLYPLLKNKPWNKVLLTYSEHAYAHYLLSISTVGKCKEVMVRDYELYFGGTHTLAN